MSKHIVVIPGDGIGEEITDSAVQVLQEVDAVCKIGLTFERRIAGGTAYDECGSPLPKETIEAAKKADAAAFIEALPEGYDSFVGSGASYCPAVKNSALPWPASFLKIRPS